MIDRRSFLKNVTVISLAPTLPAFLSESTFGVQASRDGRILVVIQLDGGNDGINTVVPFTDEGYARHRQKLQLPTKDLIKLNDTIGLHPRMKSAGQLFEEGRLSIVQGVGYPNPSRSHFESMSIWHTACPDTAISDAETRTRGNGWLGGAISARELAPGPHAMHVGDEDLPVALRGRRCTATTLSGPADLRMTLSDLNATATVAQTSTSAGLSAFVRQNVSQAYASAREFGETTHPDDAARYPETKLGQRLKLVGQMIKSNASAQVYYTSQSGYDTHAVQLPTHANLLGDFSSALKSFMDDMKSAGVQDRVLVMAFSEFGRRVSENASIGTDHGTAGPMFLAGTRLARRVYGSTPSLMDLENGDLKHSTDFRDVYSGVLREWLTMECPSTLREFGMKIIARAL